MARATKDVDALFRGRYEDFVTALDDALVDDWAPFAVERSRIEDIAGARTIHPPKRVDLILTINGVVFRRIKVEVSFGEGEIADHMEAFAAPDLKFLGLSGPDQLVGIAMAYQVAQKLHGCSDPDTAERKNDRVRDIADLILIRRNLVVEGTELTDVRMACEDIFAAREAAATARGESGRPWPPAVEEREIWAGAWPRLAEELALDMTLEEAIDYVTAFVADIGSAQAEFPDASA